MSGARLVAAAACLVLTACHVAPATEQGSLGGGAASVAGTSVPKAVVAAIAQRSRPPVSSRQAAELAVEDLLGGVAARSAKAGLPGEVTWAITAALARRTLGRVDEEVRRRGPVSDDEMASVRVVHAVVLRDQGITDEEGVTLANALRSAVLGATSEDDFMSRAKAVPHGQAHVVVQPLPVLDAESQAHFDPVFVAAAFALKVPGQVSPVVETQFGWHVIRLSERGAVPSDPARRAALTAAAMRLRVQGEVVALLLSRRARTPVVLSPDGDERMAAAVAGLR